MKYFLGKKGQQLLFILFILLIFAIISSMYFRNPIVENLEISSGSSSGSSSSSSSGSSSGSGLGISGISDIKSIMNLPGVGNNSIPSNVSENWSMVNEIVEPDGTIIQDIINTDGTVLTITNKQNVINTGTGKNVNTNESGSGGSLSGSSSTYNRNTF